MQKLARGLRITSTDKRSTESRRIEGNTLNCFAPKKYPFKKDSLSFYFLTTTRHLSVDGGVMVNGKCAAVYRNIYVRLIFFF